MYCPKCGTEFVEGVTTCSDCGLELTEEPPTAPEAKYVDWITVLADRNFGRTGLAESILQAEGIEYTVEGANAQMAYAVEPVRICVHPDDVERAKEKLEELLDGDESE